MNLSIFAANCLLLLVTLTSSVTKVTGKDDVKNKKPLEASKEEKANAKLPPCAACGNLVASFEQGLERTSRGKLEGGDAAWEEKKQGGGYATSEVRFVEIQEKLCHGVDRGEHQCHSNHHEWEELLEQWWKLDADARPTLKQFLCSDQLKVCCPEDAFGPQCTPCNLVGPNEKICSGNGKCKGSGTRKGNGQCACDKGYTGPICNACDITYFESYRDDSKLLCSACHESCLGHCTGSGPKACAACKPGYSMDTEDGCVDLDECNSHQGTSTQGNGACPTDKFCVNTEGSYTCLSCDKACKSCHADGPDSCHECADGYSMNKDKFCISNEAAGKMLTLSNTRYFTYLGLCVATAIIFQRSSAIAGVLGVVVAAYVTLSEYYLQGATGELKPIGHSDF